MKQIRSAKVHSIRRRKSKGINPLFAEGSLGYAIALDVEMEAAETDTSVTHVKLRYVIFILDLKAHGNRDDDFLYWELLSIYDVNSLETLSKEQILERKLSRTELTRDEYNKALKDWDNLFIGSMNSYGKDTLNDLHPHDRKKLESVQTPTAHVVREKKFSNYKKKQKKGV